MYPKKKAMLNQETREKFEHSTKSSYFPSKTPNLLEVIVGACKRKSKMALLEWENANGML